MGDNRVKINMDIKSDVLAGAIRLYYCHALGSLDNCMLHLDHHPMTQECMQATMEWVLLDIARHPRPVDRLKMAEERYHQEYEALLLIKMAAEGGVS